MGNAGVYIVMRVSCRWEGNAAMIEWSLALALFIGGRLPEGERVIERSITPDGEFDCRTCVGVPSLVVLVFQ